LTNTYTLFPLLLGLRARGFYHLHAAAIVSPDGQLHLICGAQQSGKTTLTTALGLAGWRPLSDDSLLICAERSTAQLLALKKSFHISDDLLARWPALDGLRRQHHYSQRAAVAGLEFFGTAKLADTPFAQIDHIILPQITNEPSSNLQPISPSEAILRLAEQSMFFQLWRAHTERQFRLLAQLASRAACHRLLAGADLLADPNRAAEILGLRHLQPQLLTTARNF
jgi:hypothetical protein